MLPPCSEHTCCEPISHGSMSGSMSGAMGPPPHHQETCAKVDCMMFNMAMRPEIPGIPGPIPCGGPMHPPCSEHTCCEPMNHGSMSGSMSGAMGPPPHHQETCAKVDCMMFN